MVRRRAPAGPRPSEHYSRAIGSVTDLVGGFRMQATARRRSGLQTGHLLAWVVGCAVGFAAYRSIMPDRLTMSRWWPRWQAIAAGHSLAMGTAAGTILTGCCLMAYRRRRGDPSYPSLAGHWLLLFGLAAAAADVAAVLAYRFWTVPDPSYPVSPYLAQFQPGGASTGPTFYHQTVGWSAGALAALGFLWAVRRRLPRRWIAVFFTFALAAAILGGGHLVVLVFAPRLVGPPLNRFFVHAYAGAVLLGAVAIVSAVDKDRRSGAPTDGPHRLGVGAWLLIAVIQLILYGVYLMG
jgi:hypothetical protein